MGEDWSIRVRKGKPFADAHPRAAWYVRITDAEHGWIADVELDDERRAVSVGLRHIDGSPVLGRDARRAPLSAYVKAAAASCAPSLLLGAYANVPETRKATEDLRRIMVPRGRPERGHSARWYLDLLAAAEAIEAKGGSAAQEIARRKRVEGNTVYQWLHRAKKIEREQIAQRGRGRR